MDDVGFGFDFVSKGGRSNTKEENVIRVSNTPEIRQAISAALENNEPEGKPPPEAVRRLCGFRWP